MRKFQQGDVIIKNTAIPSGSQRVPGTKGGFVLAKGEATGHSHVIKDDIEMYEKDGVLYIRADKPVIVFHEEHQPLEIPQGTYEIRIVREYDPFAEEARKVLD